MHRKVGYFVLSIFVVALSGCANMTNPVPVAGQHRTAQQKYAKKHQNGVETFLSEVI
ncbi:hypothetical protein HF670_06195 [Acidithiobacillus thiooxidans]|uniref:hypothetical protein n=1 Tax=Acidithiobacillus TaxID=119977 RepID=UPI001557BF5D|nr:MULTISPECIES: hypothetical protein [Acidithiobacillus]MBU2839161.1 hypothetical protein [Acidithiobacillus thiooxidans]